MLWYIVFLLVGKSTLQWSMVSHLVESCLLVFVFQGFIGTPFVINWLANLLSAFNVFRGVVCISFFIREEWFVFLNSNKSLLLGVSIVMFGFVIFNQVRYDH